VLVGVLTDRDIVIRAIAEGRDPTTAVAGALACGEVVTIAPPCDPDEAERVMAERRVRRLLVRSVEEPLEAVSINDLVRHRDRQSFQGAPARGSRGRPPARLPEIHRQRE
jgi:CBS domain-containing protein